MRCLFSFYNLLAILSSVVNDFSFHLVIHVPASSDDEEESNGGIRIPLGGNACVLSDILLFKLHFS